MDPRESNLHAQLLSIVSATPWLIDALRHVQGLGLSDWCIGAGSIREAVWDSLLGRAPLSRPSGDVDVAYFDPVDTSRSRDRQLAARLRSLAPDREWDVVNQAGVHEWYQDHFGEPFAPLGSLEEAVGSWPEYATCVGVRLLDDGSLHAIAPHGLADLFSLAVRHNPSRVGLAAYQQRLAGKRFAERWPGVTVIES